MIDSLTTDVRRHRRRLEGEAKASSNAETDGQEDDSPSELTAEEVADAKALLAVPDLIERIRQDISTLGIVGEEDNAMLLYLAMTSRKSRQPISVELRGHSGAGKSYLVQNLAALMPESEVVRHTRVTPRYLEHVPRDYVKHKVLLIAEAAGGEGAELAVRMIADDTDPRIELGYVKDNPATGEHESVTKTVEGPTCLIQTSTRTGANPEDESRWFIIEVDDSPEQRKRIQRAILRSALPHKALAPARREAILTRHRNMQRLLEPCEVAFPIAELVEYPTDSYRSNRDLKRLLNVVFASAILHQEQRSRVEIDGREVLVADVRDYEAAYEVCRRAVAHSREGLPSTSRRLLDGAKELLDAKRQQGESSPTVTRAELAELPDWDYHRVTRAVKPLEHKGYLQFKPGTNPYRYSIAREAPTEAAVDGMLTPDQMRRKVKENLHRIDPCYLGASGQVSPHFADLAPECLSGTTHTAFRPDDQGLASNQVSLEVEDPSLARVCGERQLPRAKCARCSANSWR
jgi:energy-coupling factor transporter ATP-binding protein EcfA2